MWEAAKEANTAKKKKEMHSNRSYDTHDDGANDANRFMKSIAEIAGSSIDGLAVYLVRPTLRTWQISSSISIAEQNDNNKKKTNTAIEIGGTHQQNT